MRCSGCGSKRSAREEEDCEEWQQEEVHKLQRVGQQFLEQEREEQLQKEEVARLQCEVQELQLMRQLGEQGQDKQRSPDLPHMDYKPQP